MIILPTEKRDPLRLNPSFLLLYGSPKVGKTTFLSALEDNLILDLERGSELIPALSVRIDNLSELNEAGSEIYKKKLDGKPFKYISVDTISTLEDWVEWEATETYMKTPMGSKFNLGIPREKWDSVLSLPNGAGYFWLRLCMVRWLDKLYKLSDHVILVAHLKDKLLEGKKGHEISVKDIDLIGKSRNIVSARMDAIGYMYRNEDKLMISFKSDESVVCGSRCKHLAGVEIEANWKQIFI